MIPSCPIIQLINKPLKKKKKSILNPNQNLHNFKKKNNISTRSLVSFLIELFICGKNTKKLHTSIIFQLPILKRSTEHKQLAFIKGDSNKWTYSNIYLRLNNSIKQSIIRKSESSQKLKKCYYCNVKLSIISAKYTYPYILFLI